jgi:hypothetical protein
MGAGISCALMCRRISPLSTWQMMELLLDGCWHFMCLNVSPQEGLIEGAGLVWSPSFNE